MKIDRVHCFQVSGHIPYPGAEERQVGMLDIYADYAARTVARRAERAAWALIEHDPERTGPLPAKYLNRLSDLLFVLARHANRDVGDVLWKPGGGRAEPAR